MSERPDLLIFDFDGVLAETEDLHFAAFAAALRSAGVELRREVYYERYLGLTDEASIAAAFADAGRRAESRELSELLARKRAEYAERSRGARLYPGVPRTLRALERRYPLAVASGAFRDEIVAVLARDGVDGLFRAIVSAEDVRRGKPAPDPYLRALETVNRAGGESIAADRCLVIEDAPHGIESALAAGMRVVAVATSHERSALAGAEAVLDDVNQLARLEWLA